MNPKPIDDDMAASLRSELAGMRLKALERRSVAEGAPLDAVEEAMDADDPKAALVALIVRVVASRGPIDRMASSLAAGSARRRRWSRKDPTTLCSLFIWTCLFIWTWTWTRG